MLIDPAPRIPTVSYPSLPLFTSTSYKSQLTNTSTSEHSDSSLHPHPNVGKKRQQSPNLSRIGKTSSHRVQISQIFHDAATDLSTPPRLQRQANQGQVRSPLRRIHGVEEGDRHPSKSASLVVPVQETVIEGTHTTKIDTWLEDVFTLSPSIQKPDVKAKSRVKMEPLIRNQKPMLVRNKENMPSVSGDESPSSKKYTPRHLCLPPRRRIRTNHGSSPQAYSDINLPAVKADSSSPHALFHLAPKRQRPQCSPLSHTPPTVPHNTPASKSASGISEDSDGLAELSPVVECHRKGRGPKRGRCLSYYDWDILLSKGEAQRGEGA